MTKIRIGIAGYGNLGRSAAIGVRQFPDLELAAVLTRRDPSSIERATPGVKVFALDQAASLTDRVDVMLLCGGSLSDLPEQGPWLAGLVHGGEIFRNAGMGVVTVHRVEQAGRAAGKLSVRPGLATAVHPRMPGLLQSSPGTKCGAFTACQTS